MLSSEFVLENWTPDVIYNYAMENVLEMNLSDCCDIIRHFPKPPYGWVLANDLKGEIFCCYYWNEADAISDAQICLSDGMQDIEITTEVSHDVMYELLDELWEEAQKCNVNSDL